MFPLRLTLSIKTVLLLTLSLYFSVAVAPDVFEATPAEQDDIKTIDQLNKE